MKENFKKYECTTHTDLWLLCRFDRDFFTKPFFNLNNYSVTQATIHSALAQIAGTTFTLGILSQLFYSTDKSEKWIHFTFFILVVGFSASFGLMKNYQGIFQRLLYLTSFIWLIKFYKA